MAFGWRNITTVLDLRSEGEMKRRPSGLRDRPGFTYIPCPVEGGERLPGREADVGRGYFETLVQYEPEHLCTERRRGL